MGRRWVLAVACWLAGLSAGPAEAAPPEAQAMREAVGVWRYPGEDGETTGPYLEYTPAGWDGASPLPMVIFLHGAGHRGNDIAKVYGDEVPEMIRAGRSFEAIVLCPQVETYWRGEQAAAFIDHALAVYAGRFDADRVYLTGESSGGGGAWEGAKLRAEDLAALVPIATTIGRAEGATALVGLPTWAFHNVHDPYQVVEKSRTQVEAVRAAGGAYVRLTEYTDTPGKRHEGVWPNAHRHAWETAYGDEAVWAWMFHQRRGEPERFHGPG